jgi:hypothetical protein
MRYATKFDGDLIYSLMCEFAKNKDNPLTNSKLWTRKHIDKVLAEIFAGKGFILLDNGGLLIALKAPILWIENAFQLHEIMLYGNNKFSTMRLIRGYIKAARGMITRGEVMQATLSTFNDDRLERLGLTRLEQHWAI